MQLDINEVGNEDKPRFDDICYAKRPNNNKKKVGTCKLTIVGYKNAYLFVKVFKIHEKESKNDKYSHEIWHTAIDQIKLEYEIY